MPPEQGSLFSLPCPARWARRPCSLLKFASGSASPGYKVCPRTLFLSSFLFRGVLLSVTTLTTLPLSKSHSFKMTRVPTLSIIVAVFLGVLSVVARPFGGAGGGSSHSAGGHHGGAGGSVGISIGGGSGGKANGATPTSPAAPAQTPSGGSSSSSGSTSGVQV